MMIKSVMVIAAGFIATASLSDNVFVEQFSSALSSEGSNRQKVDSAYLCLSNLFELAVTSHTDDVLAMQYQVMTNAFILRPQTNGLVRENFSPVRNLFTAVLSFPAIRTDPEAIVYCADYIGSMQRASTNDYAAELSEAVASNSVRSCVDRWRPILEYNAQIGDFRDELVTVLSPAYRICSDVMLDAARAAFETNVIVHARLSESETLRLRAGTDDDMYEELERQQAEGR